jgi:hypothetical protein
VAAAGVAQKDDKIQRHGLVAKLRIAGTVTVLSAVVAVGVAGCAHDSGVVPAPGAKKAPGSAGDSAAVENTAGVEIIADANAWKGQPRTLERVVTPVKINIRNTSGHPLRIEYASFELLGKSGRRYQAIPLVPVEHALGPQRSIVPAYPSRGFWVAPHLGAYYSGLVPWSGPFPFSAAYYAQYDTFWDRWKPTQDMLRRALPEGVLENGGTVTGFLYFSDVRETEQQVIFRAQLGEGGKMEGTQLASVRIPFVIR